MTKHRLVAATMCLLMLAACGGSSSTSGALGIITLAADKTAAAGTARVYFEIEMDLGGQAVTTTGEGEFDLAGQRGRMTMEMPGMAGGGGSIETIIDGTMIYMKYPQITAMLPGAKPWLSMDLQSMGEDMGIDMSALTQGGNSDPTQALHYLRAASGDVETLGSEEVRGVATTHYRATIDLDKVAGLSPPEIRDAVDASIDSLRSMTGIDSIPVEVWIDEDGIARRYRQSMDLTEGATAGSSMTMTMEMFDFGVEVDVQPPPNSKVTDFAELMNQIGASPAP